MKNDFPQSLSTTRSSERPCNFCKPLLFSSSLFSYAWRCCLTRHSTMCQSTSGEMCSRHWGLTRFRGDEQAYGTSWHGLPGTPRPGKIYSEAGSPGLSLIYADSFIGSSTFIQPEPLNQSKVSLIFTWREEKWELCWGKLQREATPLHPFLVDFLQNRIHPFFPITGLFPVFLWIHWYAERASLVRNYRAHSISFYLTLSWIISFLKEKGWVRRCLEFLAAGMKCSDQKQSEEGRVYFHSQFQAKPIMTGTSWQWRLEVVGFRPQSETASNVCMRAIHFLSPHIQSRIPVGMGPPLVGGSAHLDVIKIISHGRVQRPISLVVPKPVKVTVNSSHCVYDTCIWKTYNLCHFF